MLNLDGNLHVMLHVSVQKPGQQEMSTQLSKISWRLCCERFHLGKCVLLKKTMCHVEMLLVVRDAPSSTSVWPRPCSCAALMLGWIHASCCCTVRTENSFCMRALIKSGNHPEWNGRNLCEFILMLTLASACFFFFFFFTLNYHNASPHLITHADQQRVVNFPSADLGRLRALKCWGKGYGVGLGLAFSRD